jgi:hypothetical protein
MVEKIFFEGKIKNAGQRIPFSPVGFSNIIAERGIEMGYVNSYGESSNKREITLKNSSIVLVGHHMETYLFEGGVIEYLFKGRETQNGRATGECSIKIIGSEKKIDEIEKILISSIGFRDYCRTNYKAS